jgi:sigma-E processing peptidase SpoIIGA
MNLVVLSLVNRTLQGVGTRKGLLAAAVVGAATYLLPFFVPGYAILKISVCFLIGTILMIKIAFRAKTWKAYLRAIQWLLCDTFMLGGGILCLIHLFPSIKNVLTGIAGVVTIGILLYLLIGSLRDRHMRQQNICRVTFLGDNGKVVVEALIDSGNGLVEPISGKPVSVLKKGILEGLWKEGLPMLYRVIPYHSIGKKQGILMGYLIPEVDIEMDGMVRTCKEICIGIAGDEWDNEPSYQMILNPMILSNLS